MAIRLIFHVFLQIRAEEPSSVRSKPLISLCFPINYVMHLTFVGTFVLSAAAKLSHDLYSFCKTSVKVPSWGHEHRTSTKAAHDSTSISPWRSIRLKQRWAFWLVICRDEVRISARTLAIVSDFYTVVFVVPKKATILPRSGLDFVHLEALPILRLTAVLKSMLVVYILRKWLRWQ